MSYDDIIDLPHHTSQRHPQMSMWDRAAQFAPFAALTGHGDAIEETARLTQQQTQLEEDDRQLLDRKMAVLQSQLSQQPTVQITFFQPDERKEGGHYQIRDGRVKKMDEHTIILHDGCVIPIHDILDMQGNLFEEFGL